MATRTATAKATKVPITMLGLATATIITMISTTTKAVQLPVSSHIMAKARAMGKLHYKPCSVHA